MWRPALFLNHTVLIGGPMVLVLQHKLAPGTETHSFSGAAKLWTLYKVSWLM